MGEERVQAGAATAGVWRRTGRYYLPEGPCVWLPARQGSRMGSQGADLSPLARFTKGAGLGLARGR